MKITIHQALCGEKDKAWDLLETTLPDIDDAKAVAYKADLHDTANGVAWEPCIRGFAIPKYFLIMRSYLDDSGTVRPGRAFSHVLIVELSQLFSITNLQPIFDLLPATINKTAEIKPIILESKDLKFDKDPPELQEPSLGRFKKVIHGYTRLNDFKSTIIWIGPANYEMAVAELWQRLTNPEKETFNFGIYFNANALPGDKINLICIPERNAVKFQHSGYLLIGTNDQIELSSFSEQILLGNRDVNERLEAFAKDLGKDYFNREDWDTVNVGLKTYENLATETDIKKLNTLAHIIALYAPGSTKGAALKVRVTEKVAELLAVAKVGDLQLLANFKVESFSKSRNKFAKAVNKWLKDKIFEPTKIEIDNLIIFDQLNQSGKKTWLSTAFADSIQEFIHKNDQHSFSKLYDWTDLRPEVFKVIKTFIKSDAEKAMIAALPITILKSLLDTLLAFAKERKWYNFSADLHSQYLPLKEAVQAQLNLGNDAANKAALQHMLSGKSAMDIINLTLDLQEEQLYTLSANVCCANPSLLENINLDSLAWQVIWARAVKFGLNIDQGFKKFKTIAYAVFDRLVQDKYVRPEIVEAISKTKYANLLSYPRTAQLWGKLSEPVRKEFLRQTSSVLLAELSEGKTNNVPDDQVLSTYVFRSAIEDFLYYNRQKIKPVLPIFKRFTNVPNSYLMGFLRNFRGNLDAGEAKNLGKLIYQRRAEDAAHLVYQRANKSNSWTIALKECYDLLGFFDKAAMFVGDVVTKMTMSADSWWHHIEETLCTYYGNPNAITAIWRKAGGQESELLLGVPAQQTWMNAINRLKRKEFRKITMNSLLQEVKKEYGDVPAFKMLYKLRKAHIKT